MASQLDLDQGGTQRAWIPQWQGPSVGWIWVPQTNILPITVAGTYTLDRSTSLVTVAVAGSVTINLYKATNPIYGGAGMAQPGVFAGNPVTIVDTGGNANSFPITINPASGETITGLSTLQITVNYGGYILTPNSAMSTWNTPS